MRLRFTTLLALACAPACVLALQGCVTRPTLGQQCDLNTGCDTPLVCRYGRCRVECADLRDCPVGALCVEGDPTGSCRLPDEDTCERTSDCADGLVCHAGECTIECAEDRDCMGAQCIDAHCVDRTMQACVRTSDCGDGALVCLSGRCAEPCRQDRDCREGLECAAGQCAPVPFDGGLDAGTDAGPEPPDGGPDGGPRPVGSCTVAADCAAPNVETYACVDLQCQIVACAGSFADCDARFRTGCEVDTESNPAHCGRCERGCGPAGTCAAGDCDGFRYLTASNNDACAVRESGRVACFGNNRFGALGLGVPLDLTGQVGECPLVTDGVSVEVGHGGGGQDRSCMLREAGRVSCSGQGASGGIGHGEWSDTTVFTEVVDELGNPLSGALNVSVSTYNACAALSSGAVRCWGRGTNGALGNDSVEDSNVAVAVQGITDAVYVHGANATCAVLASGSVACWGPNTHFDLGDGEAVHTGACGAFGVNDCALTPVTVVGLTDAVSLAGASTAMCALRANGTVSCWGSGTPGPGSGVLSPVAMPGLTDLQQISADRLTLCGLHSDGRVSCLAYMTILAGGSATPAELVGVTDATRVVVQNAGICVLSQSRGPICQGQHRVLPPNIIEDWATPQPHRTFVPDAL